MGITLRDQLRVARHLRFIGRDAELNWFRSGLRFDVASKRVLWVHGPAGVGKTTLLHEYAYICAEAGLQTAWIPTPPLEAEPDNILVALCHALGLPAGSDVYHALSDRTLVLFFDGYEMFEALDSWFRDTFLMQLPMTVLTMVAGQSAPPARWRAEEGWSSLVAVHELANFSPHESRLYLSRRDVPSEQHDGVLSFTHGHPLALSLVVDTLAQRPGMPFQREEVPDVVKTLLQHFVTAVADESARGALEACALLRLTTEDLLKHVLALPSTGEASALFEWLRGLSFVRSESGGLAPHELVREVLLADLRWRNREWYRTLHRRASDFYAQRLRQTAGAEQQSTLFDLIHLHRHHEVVRPYFAWHEHGSRQPYPPRVADRPLLAAMVARHEGADSARLLEYWMDHQPHGMLVYRDESGAPAAMLCIVEMHPHHEAELAADPACRAAWAHLQTREPLAKNEFASVVRFWMAADTYQDVSALQSLISTRLLRYFLTTPTMAYTYFPCSDPDFWAPAFAYADFERLEQADFVVDDKSFGTYGHDWRARPAFAWLELLAERHGPTESENLSPTSYSAEEFGDHVRHALRSIGRPEALQQNGLMQTRLVLTAGAALADRPQTLRSMLEQALDGLKRTPRDARFHAALQATYFNPAGTQEQTAETLGLPFSTYRRYLKSGTDRLIEVLWNWEQHGGQRPNLNMSIN